MVSIGPPEAAGAELVVSAPLASPIVWAGAASSAGPAVTGSSGPFSVPAMGVTPAPLMLASGKAKLIAPARGWAAALVEGADAEDHASWAFLTVRYTFPAC